MNKINNIGGYVMVDDEKKIRKKKEKKYDQRVFVALSTDTLEKVMTKACTKSKSKALRTIIEGAV